MSNLPGPARPELLIILSALRAFHGQTDSSLCLSNLRFLTQTDKTQGLSNSRLGMYVCTCVSTRLCDTPATPPPSFFPSFLLVCVLSISLLRMDPRTECAACVCRRTDARTAGSFRIHDKSTEPLHMGRVAEQKRKRRGGKQTPGVRHHACIVKTPPLPSSACDRHVCPTAVRLSSRQLRFYTTEVFVGRNNRSQRQTPASPVFFFFFRGESNVFQ